MENISKFYFRYLRFIQAKDDSTATAHDKYMALSYAVRSHMLNKWIETQKKYHSGNPRRVYYLSLEYVFGKSLKQNIINLGLEKSTVEAAERLGFSLDELYGQEADLNLGNPGKGRLASCILDAMASIGIPGMGYGLNYDYALFNQEIRDGMQTEQPYDWLHKSHQWFIKRPEYANTVEFHGSLKPSPDNGDYWLPADSVNAVPYDFPIAGYKNDTVHTLRLWSAQASEQFLQDYMNHGDYIRAVEEKFKTGRITNYLFPDEDVHRATEMRIKQEYFLASASLRDIIRRYKLHNSRIVDLDKKVAIQLNGNRCAMAIPEMMRLLLDREQLDWKDAWRITRNVFSYTSHAISPDSYEKLPLYLLNEILPRHTQIIEDINAWHLKHCSGSVELPKEHKKDLSIIEEEEVKRIKMDHLGIIGSSVVNGVSKEQTKQLRKKVFPGVFEFTKKNLQSVTNGITFRRWLFSANRPLTFLLNELLEEDSVGDFNKLSELEKFANDSEVLIRFEDVKHTAKRNLSMVLEKYYGIEIDPNSFFDIHCRRIHPCKRQLLQLFYIISQYLKIRDGKEIGLQRTHIFGGRAAPADFLAKQIIHLIHIIIQIINNDPLAKNQIKVIFIPNYGMSMAEHTVPAADLSEQISTPGWEASGTSNMKFALNGAITIASQSGSNIEMIEKVGKENMVIFGKKSSLIGTTTQNNPHEIIDKSKELQAIFSFLEEILPSFPNHNMINPLIASLKDVDIFCVLRDFDDYMKKQKSIEGLYKERSKWLSMCLLNIARLGWFSCDRAVMQCSKDIWKVV